MLTARFSLDAFARDPQAYAEVAPADDLFSLLNRQVVVPASCAVLAWRDAPRPSFHAGGDTIDGGGAREVLAVKTLPEWLRLAVGPVPSGDGFACQAVLSFAVRVVVERAELESFRRAVLGSRSRAGRDTLSRFCEEAARAAVAAFIAARRAADLVSASGAAGFDAILAEHFKPLGFSSGLAVCPDARLEIASPAFAEARGREEARARREQQHQADAQARARAADERRRHLADLAGLLDQARALAESGAGAGLADLVKTFPLERRGELYRGLMAPGAASAGTRAILIVAGDEVIWLDPAAPDRPMQRRRYDGAGPLRSVRVIEGAAPGSVLVGARSGVHVLDDNGSPRQVLTFLPPRELRGGVNAAAACAGRVYATHSEAGLLGWELSAPGPGRPCLEDLTAGARSVRDVQCDPAGRLWLAVDNRAIGWLPEDASAPRVFHAGGPIQSLRLAGGHLYAGLENGSIFRWPADAPAETPEPLQPAGGGPVYSLAWLAGGGVPRLLVADRRPHLTLRVLGETFHAEYGWRAPLRWAAAAGDWIVAVDDARDRVICWRPDVPEEPAASVSIGRLCGQPVQDVALLPSSPAAMPAAAQA